MQVFWENIINEITRLQQRNVRDNAESNQDNPIVRIITPEWYYADSSEIFHGVDIVWDNLDRLELVQNLAISLKEIKINRLANDIFEASFCSWYQPYHYSPRSKWGIHIRYNSWVEIAARLNQTCQGLVSDPIGCAKASFLYLFIHSLFHYITECEASTIEITLQNPYIYTSYHSSIYEKVFNSSDCLEEALANSYLLSRSEVCHIEKGYLENMLLKQGPGYNNFLKYSGTKFRDGIRRLISQIKSGILNPPLDLSTEHTMNIANSIDYPHDHNVPIWLHKRAIPLHDEL